MISKSLCAALRRLFAKKREFDRSGTIFHYPLIRCRSRFSIPLEDHRHQVLREEAHENMKSLTIFFTVLSGLVRVHGQDGSTPKWQVEFASPLSDGKPSAPVAKPEPIDFKVLSSRTQQMEVTKASEMSDLPPIKGTINVTVQMVEDPGLPDPPSPLPDLPPDDPAVIARMREIRKNYHGAELVFLSATVYDHSRTLLRIYPNGQVEGMVTAWSNLDFNYFSGFSTFQVKTADGNYQSVGLIMGIGNNITVNNRKRMAHLGGESSEEKIPNLPDLLYAGPTYLVITGDDKSEAMNTLGQVHELYRKEGPRMEAAYYASEKAQAERKADLIANPPVPEDIVIRFWQQDQSAK